MEQDWVKIRTYGNAIHAEMDKQLLESNNISAVVLNKQDSSLKFGRIELYVMKETEEQAYTILTDPNMEEE